MAQKDYIDRAGVMAALDEGILRDENCPLFVAAEVDQCIGLFPASDVRPVVLCRDCKHKGWVPEPCHGKSVDYCHIFETTVPKGFFCAAGERKEGGPHETV